MPEGAPVGGISGNDSVASAAMRAWRVALVSLAYVLSLFGFYALPGHGAAIFNAAAGASDCCAVPAAVYFAAKSAEPAAVYACATYAWLSLPLFVLLGGWVDRGRVAVFRPVAHLLVVGASVNALLQLSALPYVYADLTSSEIIWSRRAVLIGTGPAVDFVLVYAVLMGFTCWFLSISLAALFPSATGGGESGG